VFSQIRMKTQSRDWSGSVCSLKRILLVAPKFIVPILGPFFY
jgi:hypothetical protein